LADTEHIDILLISPFSNNKGGAIWKQIQRSFPSNGILCLAAYIREKGFSVKVIDGVLESLSNDEICKRILAIANESGGIRYIGLSVTTLLYYTAAEIAIFAKNNLHGIKIIFGGPHPSSLPSDVIAEAFVDYVIRGEGEYALADLLENKLVDDIGGLTFIKNGLIIHNPDRPRIRNLDILPMPAYDLVPIERSKPFIGQFVGLKKVVPSTLIIATRGCIGKCTFCSKTFAPGVAYKSAKKIIEEIEFLQSRFKIQHFVFYDDTFTSNQKLISEFCETLILKKIAITWTCSSRVDCVSRELLFKMKEAGCTQVLYGVESFSDDVLKSINKIATAEDNINAIKWTKETGMIVRIAIMIGNPADTIETLENNIKLLRKYKPDLIQVTIATPLPGSALYKSGVENNKITCTDWEKYNGDYIVMQHPVLTEKDLKKYYLKTYQSFYLSPRYLLKKAFSFSTYMQIGIYLSALFSLLPVFLKSSKRKDIK